ncbi:MAG: TetR/AcrR family transcriptional regulator [Bacteroidia bacterium]
MPKVKIDRKTLLKNSLSVFKEKGYAAASMSDLAAANGLLKGSMYHYVEGKEALMKEILIALKDHYVDKVFSKAYDEDLSPVQRLKELASRAEEIFMHEEGGDFFVNIGLETSKSNDAFAAIIRSFFAEWIKTLQHLYAFVLNGDDARVKAETTVAEIEGAVILMRLLKDGNYLTRTNENLMKEYKELYSRQNQDTEIPY